MKEIAAMSIEAQCLHARITDVVQAHQKLEALLQQLELVDWKPEPGPEEKFVKASVASLVEQGL